MVTALSCAERALGFLYRIFLSRSAGAEGLGLYQIALSVIGVLITVSASGIPITVSRLMIKQRATEKGGELSAVSAGITAALATCVPIVAGLFLTRNRLGFLFADDRCVNLFLIMLPGVVVTSVYAVIRGFFWGKKRFYTYAVIELAEESVMIIAGVILVANQADVYLKTVGASVAVTVSYLFSFVTSLIAFFVLGGRFKNPKPLLKPLCVSATPITLMRTATSLTGFLIAVILPAALIKSGLSQAEAVSSFGVISGMTMPLLFMPSTIIGSISLVLVPELAENFYKKRYAGLQNNVEKALLYSSVIAAFIIPVFIGTGEYLCRLIYKNATAGVYLEYAAPLMLPMSVTMISNSLLNSMGMERRTLAYFGAGSVFLLLSVWLLPAKIGNGALIAGYLLSFTVTAVLNVRLLTRICCKKLEYLKKLVILIAITAGASAFCFLSFKILSNFFREFFACAISCGITLLCDYLAFCAAGIMKPLNILKPKKRSLFIKSHVKTGL